MAPKVIFSSDKTVLFYIPQTNRILTVKTETGHKGQGWT